MKIQLAPNGPILVQGEITLVHSNGSEEVKKNPALCRCGDSDNKPFCDGSHKGAGFEG